MWRAATDLGEHRAVGTERVRDEAGGEECRAHALGLGRVGDRDDDAREPQRAAVLSVERADHRMVLGGPRGHAAAHEAAEHGAVEHLVRMNDRRQHAPHGIAVEDAFVEAGRALVGVDLEDVRHPRQVRELHGHAGRGRQLEHLDAVGLGVARRLREIDRRLQRGETDGGQIVRAIDTRSRPRRDHDVVGAPERRERRVRPGHVDHGEGADVLRLLIGGHHRHTRERQRPTVAGPRHAAEDARKILAAVHLRAWRDDVEHAPDAAALVRVHEVETNAGKPRIGGQERA